MINMKIPFFNIGIIKSLESFEKTVKNCGILPFFSNNVRGVSVEEMCQPGKLFGGNHDEGCWEWKGPVIRKKEAAYGKFFRRKAGFISKDLLPYFLRYRRAMYPIIPGSVEEMIYDIIRENDSLTSTQLKYYIFGTHKRRKWDDVPDNAQYSIDKSKSKGLETPLQRLQMGGWILISDFEYKITKGGERYGWGVARYSTPENLFDKLDFPDLSPFDSLDFIINRMKMKYPFTKREQFYRLLK